MKASIVQSDVHSPARTRSLTMTTRNPGYSREEFARRGETIYHRDIEPTLGAEDENKFVAIDIETGRYEIDRDDFMATELLLQKLPDAQIWLVRVGHQAAYRMGGRSLLGGGE